MTIAIGLIAGNGAVLATDAEESYGHEKRAVGKLVMCPSKHVGIPRTIGIAGAGTSDYLDAFADVVAQISKSGEASSAEELEERIKQELLRFYDAHVIPFSRYPEDQIPNMNLAIVHGKFAENRLWITSLNTLRREPFYGAVGIGSFHALRLLGHLYRPDMPISDAVRLAAYVIDDTRRSVHGCGQRTDVMQIKNGHLYELVDRKLITQLEAAFERLRALEWDVFRYCFNAVSYTHLTLPTTPYV